jgi:hypothetical protein
MALMLLTVVEARGGNPPAAVEVLAVSPEPFGQGKNVVRVTVRNMTAQPQVLGTYIQTQSPNVHMGWGTTFFETIPPSQETTLRLAYKIPGPIVSDTWVRLRFNNPPSREPYKAEEYFLEKRYQGNDLKGRAQEALQEASTQDSAMARQALSTLQQAIGQGQYDQAWQQFTKDYQQAEWQERKEDFFFKAMKGEPAYTRFVWEKDAFLRLEPTTCQRSGKTIRLICRTGQETWSLDFVEADGKVLLDWIGGYTSQAAQRATWPKTLLPTMQKRSSEHIDAYYFAGSTAEKDIERIIQAREQGIRKIAEFLGVQPRERITLVLFEDQETKYKNTGHQGLGWAVGNMMVEVYHSKEHLDPYHETTHVLAGQLGNPPAILVEGLGVYMSEYLKAAPLENLEGGKLSLYEKVAQAAKDKQTFPLKTVFGFTDIGSQGDKTTIAYAQAGAFVKFLIDQYGKDKFLQAYRTLKNGDSATVRQANEDALQKIYGAPLAAMEQEMMKTVQQQSDQM